MGFFDWANGFLEDGFALIKSAAVIIAAVLFISTAIKTRGGIVAMILAGIAGGFIIWAVTMNGLGWFSTGIGGETIGLGVSSQMIGS